MSSYPPPGATPDPPPGAQTGPDTRAQAGPQPGSAGWRLDEALERMEAELRQAVAYVNDAVIPQVRRESIFAMRSVADTLRALADRFEAGSRPPRGPQP